MNQYKTPLYDQLVLHAERNPYSFHVPGHKYGQVKAKGMELYYKNIMLLDATELSGLDDLHSPEGVILEAENLLASLYKVKKSFFLVNGSTVGNLAMMMATLKPKDIVLVQRNSHKSIINGINLSGAIPVYLGPEINQDLNVASGVSIETVQLALKEYPTTKAIILTYPNYYGLTYNLREIIDYSHKLNIPVLIDEAHGAHFIASAKFPPSAIELGADIVVQSAHKTLPALTMGSYLHFNSGLISQSAVAHYLNILQSSSPSYPILGSLDIARSYIGTYSEKDESVLFKALKDFRTEVSKIEGIRLSNTTEDIDPLKITIQSLSSLTGFEIQALLEHEGIYTELADPNNVLLVMPLLKEGTDSGFSHAVEKIRKALMKVKYSGIKKKKQFFMKPKVSRPILDKAQMDNLLTKTISITQAVGHINAEMIIPYPPGIPLLIPGEVISLQDIEALKKLLEHNAKFQGGQSLKEGKLTVYNSSVKI